MTHLHHPEREEDTAKEIGRYYFMTPFNTVSLASLFMTHPKGNPHHRTETEAYPSQKNKGEDAGYDPCARSFKSNGRRDRLAAMGTDRLRWRFTIGLIWLLSLAVRRWRRHSR